MSLAKEIYQVGYQAGFNNAIQIVEHQRKSIPANMHDIITSAIINLEPDESLTLFKGWSIHKHERTNGTITYFMSNDIEYLRFFEFEEPKKWLDYFQDALIQY